MSRIFKQRNPPDTFNSTSHRTAHVNRRVGRPESCVRKMTIIVALQQTLEKIATDLERRYNLDLSNCQFYLNDHIPLDGSRPISDHCVENHGMVKLVLEIKSMPTHTSYRFTRLNVVDILSVDSDVDCGDAQVVQQSVGPNGMPQLAPGAPAVDDLSNSEAGGSSTGSDSKFIPSSQVAEALEAATRAMEQLNAPSSDAPTADTIPTSSSSSVGTVPSAVHPPSVYTATSASALNYASSYGVTSSYSSMSDRYNVSLNGAGGGLGGKWVVDSHYRTRMSMNHMPIDPGQWSETQVIMWINWAVKQFNLVDTNPNNGANGGTNGTVAFNGNGQTNSNGSCAGGDSNQRHNAGGDGGKLAKSFYKIEGVGLLECSAADLAEKFRLSGSPATPNLTFFTHFELLKRCREVCVPYKPQVQQFPVQQTSTQRAYRQVNKSRPRNGTRTGMVGLTDYKAALYQVNNGSSLLARYPNGSVSGVTVFAPTMPTSSSSSTGSLPTSANMVTVRSQREPIGLTYSRHRANNVNRVSSTSFNVSPANFVTSNGGTSSRLYGNNNNVGTSSVSRNGGRISYASVSANIATTVAAATAMRGTVGSMSERAFNNPNHPAAALHTYPPGARPVNGVVPVIGSVAANGSAVGVGGGRRYRVVSEQTSPHQQLEPGAVAMTPYGGAFAGSSSNSSVVSPSLLEAQTGNGCQIHLWQFLLDLLTDWRHQDIIHWVEGGDGEFLLVEPELVAQLWGKRKKKPRMNYEKLSRALRYYYDGDMISKVQSRRFCYKYICDLKVLLGYSAGELKDLMRHCARKHGMVLKEETPNPKYLDYDSPQLLHSNPLPAPSTSPSSLKRSVEDDESWFDYPPPSPHRLRLTSFSSPQISSDMLSMQHGAEEPTDELLRGTGGDVFVSDVTQEGVEEEVVEVEVAGVEETTATAVVASPVADGGDHNRHHHDRSSGSEEVLDLDRAEQILLQEVEFCNRMMEQYQQQKQRQHNNSQRRA